MSYLAFSLLFVGVALLPVAAAALRGRTGRRWWLAVAVAMAALVLLTVIFDSLMVSVDLFRYDASRTLGVDVLLAPLEDLTWPIASALLLPSLWVLSGRVRRGTRRSASRPPRPRPAGRSPR